MSPKWAKMAHFGDISYNVFNRRKSSYLIIEAPYFPISRRMDHLHKSNHQKFIFVAYFLKGISSYCPMYIIKTTMNSQLTRRLCYI